MFREEICAWEARWLIGRQSDSRIKTFEKEASRILHPLSITTSEVGFDGGKFYSARQFCIIRNCIYFFHKF